MTTNSQTTLASIAFALRFYNMTDEEDAKIPAPWGYQNIPAPVATETRNCVRFGRGIQPVFTEVIERFADGSSFIRCA